MTRLYEIIALAIESKNITSQNRLAKDHPIFRQQLMDWVGTMQHINDFERYIRPGYLKEKIQNPVKTRPEVISNITIQLMHSNEYNTLSEVMYTYEDTPYGSVLVASTTKGICYISFYEDAKHALLELQAHFPKTHCHSSTNAIHSDITSIFNDEIIPSQPLKLHIKGTAFQIAVWNALLKIPMGELATYGEIAQNIQREKASRAVGSAIGKNPVAYLIPCHRIITSSATLGGFKWGTTRKRAMIAREAILSITD